jgi:hypothetical protein
MTSHFCLNSANFLSHISLAVIIIGIEEDSTRTSNSFKPPKSFFEIPSTSSTRIILFSLTKDLCYIAGFRISFNFSLFLKSEAFNSNISETVSFAATWASAVFPVPGGP